MHWEVEKEEHEIQIPEDVVDLVFEIRCKVLPVDNAWALYKAIAHYLPWIDRQPRAAIHPLRVAESSHGWSRPEGPDELLHLSRRTKLVLRLPAERVEEAMGLAGKTLDVAGYPMEVVKGAVRHLHKETTLTARYVVLEEGEDEEAFLQRQVKAMRAMGLRPKKVLPGLEHTLRTPDGELRVLRLTVEGLGFDGAFILQEEGLGAYQHLGCGIFIPQKPLA